MGKFSLSKIAKNAQLVVRKHQPGILTGIGIAGMITTTIMVARATPKALDLMSEVKEKHRDEPNRKAFAKDVVTKVAPVYIPSAIVGGLSIACLVGASSVNHKRNAALATAYTLSESALKEYQEKVVETIGEKKERDIRDAVAKDEIDRNPVSKNEVIVTGGGDMLCYDILGKRYFKSNIDKLKRVANELNHRLRCQDYVSVNEFYYEVGLDGSGFGEEFGWHIERGYIELDFSSHLTEDGEFCLVVGFENRPEYDFRR
jgi:hypothetical protein